ncbi:Nuclear pore complex protein Nup214 [Rhizoctonia solani]|uniref:Nuclear pore complex protein Nup214 n=1 Tax=Rhizoctonia solani TaxID=456999 RepID=A0A0K6G1Y4_9AGAM|nr:Nuclear pore complex protein Nup214 [Rhizoctonia solani]
MPRVNIASVGVTEAPRRASAARDSPIGVFPSPASKDNLDDNHCRSRRRVFIGPMPENIAARLRAAASGDTSTSIPNNEFTEEDFARDNIANDESSSSESGCHDDHSESGSDCDHGLSHAASSRASRRVSRKRLLRAFVSRGGDRRHFSEREIWKKWHAGGWSRVPLPADASARRWVGTSFEVGVDILGGMSSHPSHPEPERDATGANEPQSPEPRSSTGLDENTDPVSPPPPSRTTTMETFMTARSRRSSGSDQEDSVYEAGQIKNQSKPIDGLDENPNNTSKASLTQSKHGEQSSQMGGTRQTDHDTPISTSPRLRDSPPANKPRPHSTLGIPNILDSQPQPGPSNASESHLPVVLSPRADLKETGLRSALRRNFNTLKTGTIKQRSVVFAESPRPLSEGAPDPFSKVTRSTPVTSALPSPPAIARAPSETPVSPAEVLNRESEPTDTTSAGAAVALLAQKNQIPEDGIILRDRMLVRAAYNRSSGLPKPYDEAQARRHPDTQEMQWKEMLVVWRRSDGREDRVELYQDYTTPGKERILGHKDLAFMVPLTEGTTNVSLYSHVDLTFCLTCPPTPVRTGTPSKRARFHRAPIGTNIFVCKLKSRTRALNWIWNLWRYLGGKLPDTIDIHCPALGTRVRVDMPDLDHGASDSWKRFTRSYLIKACGRSLRGLPDWDSMMQSPTLRGSRLELAWRKESKLDWVWQSTDEEGKDIDWQVLFGLAMRQPSLPSQLEIRLGLHAPTHVSLTDGSHLDEPPAVEGYLHRIKPKTLTRTNVYLTSHDGYLFTLRYADAEPPMPPVLIQEPFDNAGRRKVYEKELRRARCMILNSDGYIDLRSILAVRRAVEPTPPIGTIDIGATRSRRLSDDTQDHEDFDDAWVDQTDASDGEDEGGDEPLARNDDKTRLKMKRSFELIMRSGRVVRFEAYSRSVCLQWIENLRKLIKYWTRRHRVDARDEMELVFATQGRTRFTTPRAGKEEAPEGWIPDGASPYLAKFWNWCVLDGCRTIAKAGRLYTKKGIRKQFKHHFHVLTGGHLVLYHITPNVTSYHRHSRTVNLADAYVYSGQIAMRSLPRAAGVDSRQKIPRRYQDGLESDDSEEDTTFIIWYRPHSTHIPLDPLLSSEPAVKDEPSIAPLGGKHKLIICKARSRLERDAWCWVLNAEIERLSRMLSTREKYMRNQGVLVPE